MPRDTRLQDRRSFKTPKGAPNGLIPSRTHRLVARPYCRRPLFSVSRTKPGHRFPASIPIRFCRTVLVCERDDDQNGDHDKGDRVSIKLVFVDVDSHGGHSFFEDASETIRRDGRRSNSASAVREAQQHG
jgi:hypothetical protein